MDLKKPIGSLSFDLDNKWSYMKTHGDPEWESFPSYLNILVPRVLNFLGQRKLTVTFFIVGQDAALRENYEILRSIADAGHEIGNHSFHHEPWMHLYSQEQIETELTRAEDQIEHVTGRRPLGFRAPGYGVSHATVRVLAGKGYLYDASSLPSLLGPIARSYYFMTAQFTPEQRRQRNILGGTLRDGLRPIRPYRWNTDTKTLVEIPVTTMPLFRTPIHVSYLFCLSLFSRRLALQYFKMALGLCSLTGTQPSLLLHPTDFLGPDEMRELSFIPGMSLSGEKKMEFVSDVLRSFSEEFTVLTLQQHAREAIRVPLPLLEADFPSMKSPKQ
jgi:peptidoglycan-N-acetylglucosamine deacetylase